MDNSIFMSLPKRIDVLMNDIRISNNPKSHFRNGKVLGLLLAAQQLWNFPGRQAIAIKLEKEANSILNDPKEY